MTVNTNVMEQLEKGVPENVIPILHEVLSKQEVGDKIILKERTTKSAVYLQIYEYDKYSWRYVLRKKVKVR